MLTPSEAIVRLAVPGNGPPTAPARSSFEVDATVVATGREVLHRVAEERRAVVALLARCLGEQSTAIAQRRVPDRTAVTDHRVLTEAAVDEVVAEFTEQVVVAALSSDVVVALLAPDGVVTGVAPQGVAAGHAVAGVHTESSRLTEDPDMRCAVAGSVDVAGARDLASQSPVVAEDEVVLAVTFDPVVDVSVHHVRAADDVVLACGRRRPVTLGDRADEA